MEVRFRQLFRVSLRPQLLAGSVVGILLGMHVQRTQSHLIKSED